MATAGGVSTDTHGTGYMTRLYWCAKSEPPKPTVIFIACGGWGRQTGDRAAKLMKRLFVSFFLAFSTPAIAGDMGNADIQNRNDLPVIAQFDAQCVGPMDKWEGPECIVKFNNYRMTVDNSPGITKEQIKSISTNWGSDVRKYIDVLYQASDGSMSLAQFGFRYNNRAKQFLNSLVLFMGGKLGVAN